MDEAVAVAHARAAPMLAVLYDLEAEGAVTLHESQVAAALERAELAWLNGCLVGPLLG
jgi:hypothetical protein